MSADGACPEYVTDGGFGGHRCGRPVKDDDLCGLHLAAARRRNAKVDAISLVKVACTWAEHQANILEATADRQAATRRRVAAVEASQEAEARVIAVLGALPNGSRARLERDGSASYGSYTLSSTALAALVDAAFKAGLAAANGDAR